MLTRRALRGAADEIADRHMSAVRKSIQSSVKLRWKDAQMNAAVRTREMQHCVPATFTIPVRRQVTRRPFVPAR